MCLCVRVLMGSKVCADLYLCDAGGKYECVCRWFTIIPSRIRFMWIVSYLLSTLNVLGRVFLHQVLAICRFCICYVPSKSTESIIPHSILRSSP